MTHGDPRSTSEPGAPAWAVSMIERLCSDELQEELLGDLEEACRRRRRSHAAPLAALFIARDALSLLRPVFLRRRRQQSRLSSPAMISNYARIAWRGFRRNRSYSLLNVFGLGVGVACCLLIGLYIADELSVDRHFDDLDRLYRVTSTEADVGGSATGYATTQIPLRTVLEDDYPTIEQSTRFFNYSVLLKSTPDRTRQEDALAFVDSSFFEVFSFEFVRGVREGVFREPNVAVLTESGAARYFGAADPVGQSLTLSTSSGSVDLVVQAVIRDVPAATHFSFDVAVNFETILRLESHMNSWYWPPVHTYVKLPRDVTPASVERNIAGIQAAYLDGAGLERDYSLQPVRDIHLHSNLQNEIGAIGSLRALVVLGAIAALILLIAGINFVNLATARSLNRAREVGMRKTLGARRLQLIQQFLAESSVTAAAAMIFAVVLSTALLPVFNDIAGKQLALAQLLDVRIAAILAAGTLVIGLATGLYPAFVLSGHDPLRSLSGGASGRSGSTLRRALVVVQFSITSVLLIGTLVIVRQMDFVLNDRLGFDKEHVVVIPLRDRADQMDHDTLREEWLRDPRIISAAASSGYPGLNEGLHGFEVAVESAPDDSISIPILTAGIDYARTFGLEFVDGRDFSEDRPTDATSAFIVNESAARRLGLEKPVGTGMALHYHVLGPVTKPGEIIGVVRDFQYGSLHRAAEPMVLHVQENSFFNDYISARLAPEDVTGALTHLESVWRSFNPERPFEYQFLDEVFDAQYRSDMRLAKVMTAFSLLGILLACLGLFSLAAYSTERRTREIGIRKVLGASTSSIVSRLSGEFLLLVGIAFLLGLPLGYIGSSRWLDGFAEHIPLEPSLFLLAAVLTLGVGMGAVAMHAVRAAMANPADSLRSE